MSVDQVAVYGHRGFKGKYVENTIEAFEECYECGAEGIETDVWLTMDDILVISHDISTKRIFCDVNKGETNFNIMQTNFDELKDLQTIHSGEKLVTFKQFLKWFEMFVDLHGSKDYKVMLDIKKFNPAKIVKILIKDLLLVRNDIEWWLQRVLLGIWDLKIIKFMNQDPFFQDVFGADGESKNNQLDIFHISFSWRDSIHYVHYNDFVDSLPSNRRHFKITGISILYLLTWSNSFLNTFLPNLLRQKLKLWTWTINSTSQLDYFKSLKRVFRLLDCGIITDYPDDMVNYQTKAGGWKPDDEELVSDLTRLTSEPTDKDPLGDESVVRLSWSQRIIYALFRVFNCLLGVKRVTDEELEFDAPVDENKISSIKVNKFVIWVFSTCQKYGLF